MKLRARPFLRKKEVETGRLGAERPGAVEDPHADFDQVAPLLPHGGTQHDSLVGGPDRLVEVTPLVRNLRKTTQLLISSASVAWTPP